MPIIQISSPEALSNWSIANFISVIRTEINQLTEQELSDTDIRNYINLGISYIYMLLGDKIDEHYTMDFIAAIDTPVPYAFIDLSLPITQTTIPIATLHKMNLYSHLHPRMIAAVAGNYNSNGSIRSNSPNVFQEIISKSVIVDPMPANIFSIIHHINTVSAGYYKDQNIGNIAIPLRKLNVNEFVSKVKKDRLGNDLGNYLDNSEAGYWSMQGIKLMLYLPDKVRTQRFVEKVNNTLYYYSPNEVYYDIFFTRYPMLDNLLDYDNVDSSYYRNIDLPDSHIYLLTLLVKRLCLSQLTKTINPELDNMIAQITAQITQFSPLVSKQQASSINKVELGYEDK